MYQLANTITCEIIDPTSPNMVCGFYMDLNETLHSDSLRDYNMCPAKLNGCIMQRPVLLFHFHSISWQKFRLGLSIGVSCFMCFNTVWADVCTDVSTQKR